MSLRIPASVPKELSPNSLTPIPSLIEPSDISRFEAKRLSLRTVIKKTPIAYADHIEAIDMYLPHLLAALNASRQKPGVIKHNAAFKWKSTLSARVRKVKKVTHPKVSGSTLWFELTYVLLNRGYALCNMATAMMEARGSNDDEFRLNQAADKLIQAAGTFTYIADEVLVHWKTPVADRPPEGDPSVVRALALMALSDGQLLAIRKARLKSMSNSTLSKLYIDCAVKYEEALALFRVRMQASSSGPLSIVKSGELDGDLVQAAQCGVAYCRAMVERCLAVDVYEKGEIGKAVALIKNALKRVQSAHQTESNNQTYLLNTLNAEQIELKLLADTYIRVNDSVSFQPVPSIASLGNIYPQPRSLLTAKIFIPPPFAFGNDVGVISYGKPNMEMEIEQLSKLSIRSDSSGSNGNSTSQKGVGGMAGTSSAYY
ncbi:hypothetical protein SmJEL517_g01435 [Synchytrium microbalum]|uniref:pH-response regulator protein palC n=1 Tax=Synchytrium microbalum TaxID=1806994 RepID=A0A507C3R1_9FUNG|nr:uncharacterized protein SmJEL517_g01435 [Synchytrium microbalum]TPX36170.1 hypothetical protein SmJEL517_g01435 [Synchytrium microbalum]